MLRSEIYTRIIDFINAVLDNTAITVQVANQTGEVPSGAWVDLSISNFKNHGGAFSLSLNNTGILDVGFSETFIVSLKAGSNVLHEAEDILSKICKRLYLLIAKDYFGESLSFMYEAMPVSAIPTVLNQTFQSRAAVDLAFSAAHSIEDDVGIIETVQITNLTNNQTYIINKE